MSNWTDKELIEAVLRHDSRILERCYRDFKSYFTAHASAFFMSKALIDDIFQESIIHLWREIETRRIEIHEDDVCRWNNGQLRPMTSSLRTFLLAIAKRKHWEQLRIQAPLLQADVNDVLAASRYADTPPQDSSDEEVKERVVADAVLAMSDRCRQILTLFYYEHKSLEDILAIRPENTSKIGLKTSKYKCMQRLRQTVKDQFVRLHLHL
jgi:DNA-directed RNA polymerase specialized sigma24 family protein